MRLYRSVHNYDIVQNSVYNYDSVQNSVFVTKTLYRALFTGDEGWCLWTGQTRFAVGCIRCEISKINYQHCTPY
jgi:hypothetical protein